VEQNNQKPPQKTFFNKTTKTQKQTKNKPPPKKTKTQKKTPKHPHSELGKKKVFFWFFYTHKVYFA